MRPTVLTILLLCITATSARSQDWVKDMFETNSHDFGNVPRGAKSEYMFKVTNKYEEDVHIASVRSSCNCTIASIKDGNDLLKTYEQGAILCEFNTRAFVGSRAAVVTVVFDKPFYGEMQLMIKGNIRSDIVTEPGRIRFGDVEQGSEKETTVRVTYAGSNPWKIKDVRSANKNLSVKLQQMPTPPGKVEYVMNVRLMDSASAGELNDQIVLVTNDAQFNLVTIPVQGSIVPPLVMPKSVELGTIATGQSVTKRIIIKGQEPFAITKVECQDQRFTFMPPEGERTAHIIPVRFDSDQKVGVYAEKVVVHTSLPTDNQASTVIKVNVSGE